MRFLYWINVCRSKNTAKPLTQRDCRSHTTKPSRTQWRTPCTAPHLVNCCKNEQPALHIRAKKTARCCGACSWPISASAATPSRRFAKITSSARRQRCPTKPISRNSSDVFYSTLANHRHIECLGASRYRKKPVGAVPRTASTDAGAVPLAGGLH